MKLLHALPPYNFPGIEEASFEKARFISLPVPYDGTASYGAGAKDAPHAIITASRQLELYDRELQCKPCDAGIFTLGELAPARGDAKETCRRVKDAASQILEAGKTPVTLGGDHSVAIGCVQAAASKFNDLSVLCLDAHLDCWDEFEGSSHSHASVGSRIAELTPLDGLTTLSDLTPAIAKTKVNEVIAGCRTASQAELEFCRKHAVHLAWAEEIKENPRKAIDEIIKQLKRNVYITLDFDALDPSIIDTGTPEPDGLSYRNAVNILASVTANRNVVGMDFCELIPGRRASEFTAAKLVYKAISLAWKGNQEKSR